MKKKVFTLKWLTVLCREQMWKQMQFFALVGKRYIVSTEKGLIAFFGLGWKGKREAFVTGIEILKDG